MVGSGWWVCQGLGGSEETPQGGRADILIPSTPSAESVVDRLASFGYSTNTSYSDQKHHILYFPKWIHIPSEKVIGDTVM